MSVSSLPRRLVAAMCFAVLVLSSVSLAGAVVVRGGAACEAMAASPSSGHACAPTLPPPVRVSGCASAPCCVLTPDGAEPESKILPAPQAGFAVEIAPPSPGAFVAAPARSIGPRSCSEPTSSGRDRLSLHSVLLI